ncbi:MAG: alpha/beta hydrolase [Anaerolineae bacterium]
MSEAKLKLEPITFSSRDGLQLEGLIYHFGDNARRPAAVVCHPHPLYGGSMRSSLIANIACTLAGHGFVVLRFNFRGVGGSEGRHDAGYGEQQDVAGAVSALLTRNDVDPERVYLAGWSFGARVGLAYGAQDERLAGFAVVGLPTGSLAEDFLQADTRPKLFLLGEHDQFSNAGKLKRWVEGMAGPAHVVVMDDTDHFLAGREQEGADLIANFVDGLAQEENP